MRSSAYKNYLLASQPEMIASESPNNLCPTSEKKLVSE